MDESLLFITAPSVVIPLPLSTTMEPPFSTFPEAITASPVLTEILAPSAISTLVARLIAVPVLLIVIRKICQNMLNVIRKICRNMLNVINKIRNYRPTTPVLRSRSRIPREQWLLAKTGAGIISRHLKTVLFGCKELVYFAFARFLFFNRTTPRKAKLANVKTTHTSSPLSSVAGEGTFCTAAKVAVYSAAPVTSEIS